MPHSFNTQPPEGGWLVLSIHTEHGRMFQHTAARRRLVLLGVVCLVDVAFQHTAARRRLEVKEQGYDWDILLFQHTAARRRLEL